jgi:pimeloyl-ACP methyl ester carboxylesterase
VLTDPFHLERSERPLMLIWGDRDRMVSHKGSRHLLQALPDTRYELYEGIGHCPQVEVPHRVVEDIEAFVGTLDGVTDGRRARTA